MSIRTDRLGNIILEEISKILMTEIKDEDIEFVTINYVRVSTDLSYAKVYFTTLIDEKRDIVTKALNRASGFIRTLLSDRVDVRKVPELTFIYDDAVTSGQNIDKILNQIKEEEE